MNLKNQMQGLFTRLYTLRMIAYFRYLFVFLLGFRFGVFMSSSHYHLHSSFNQTRKVQEPFPVTGSVDGLKLSALYEIQQNENLQLEKEIYQTVPIKKEHNVVKENFRNVKSAFFNDSHMHADDTSLADRLFQEIRVLCLVMTHLDNHLTKAVHVNATWSRRCTKVLFVTRQQIPNLPTLIVNVTDGREFLGHKTRGAFNNVYANYLDDYDWFMKADDDTYVIMENLRYFLSAQDHNSPVYFGYHFVTNVKEGYASGGAGYVISKEGLRRYGEKSAAVCKFNSGFEDVDFGQCMELLGVKLGDGLDSLGRTRFHCFPLETHLQGNFMQWFYEFDKYKGKKKGIENLSDYAISFHYVTPDHMYLLEYVVYHLSPYGIRKSLQNLNVNNTARGNR